MEQDKPFACSVPDCGMTFHNEDHLMVHVKKHELSLSLTPSSFKTSFFDQTPTPTRFLTALDAELFQDLHTDNPFDATFRRANSLSNSSNSVNIPESSNLIANLPDTEPLSTPSITLVNESDLPLFGGHHRTGVISIKKPFVLEKSKSNENSPDDLLPIDTDCVDLIGETDIGKPENNKLKNRTNEIKLLINKTSGMSVVPTSVITTLSSQMKQNVAYMPTTTVVNRPITSNTIHQATSISQVPIIAKPVELVPDKVEVAQPVVQSVSVTPVVQLIIRLPDGQTMPVQLPVVNIDTNTPSAAATATSTNRPIKTITNISPKKTNSSLSLTKMKLKQALMTQKTGQKHNHSFPSSEDSGSSINCISSSLIISENGLNDSPPSSPPHRPLSNGRRRRDFDDDPAEKRKKSLERNRAAATRCRQKRKQWIQTLGTKADELTTTNVQLQNEVNILRDEVAHLKTMLLAHKNCPVTQQQKASGFAEIILPTTVPLHITTQMDSLQAAADRVTCIPVMELMDGETNSSQSGDISDTSELSLKDR